MGRNRWRGFWGAVLLGLPLLWAEGGRGAESEWPAEIKMPVSPLLTAEQHQRLEVGKVAEFQLNLPLLQRLLLETDDLKDASIALSIAPVEGSAFADAGPARKNTPGNAEKLADHPGATGVTLAAGETVAFTAWTAAWHFNGRAVLSDFVVRRDGGDPVAGPAFDGGPEAETPLGWFRLAGVTHRERFPGIVEVAPVRPAKTPGLWHLPESGNQASIRVENGGRRLTFHTNGRAEYTPVYNWAPLLVFTAREAGTYDFSAAMTFESDRAGHEVAWRFGKAVLPPDFAGRRLEMLRLDDQGEVVAVLGTAVVEAGDARGKTARFEGLAPALRAALEAGWDGKVGVRFAAPSVAVSSGGAGRPADGTAMLAARSGGSVTLRKYPEHFLFEDRPVIRDGVFARDDGGRLRYGDERLRLWGMVGLNRHPDRVRQMGFNAQRLWENGSFFTAQSLKRGEIAPYTRGDDSPLDRTDKYVAALRERNIFIMFAGMIVNGGSMTRVSHKPLLDDDSFIAGGDDWAEWKAAFAGKFTIEQGLGRGFQHFDDRYRRLQFRVAEAILRHVNPYTGRSYGDEEAIAVYEVANEGMFLKRWLENGFGDWPTLFRDRLRQRWNGWLTERYGDDAGLAEAWGGRPGADEALADGTVALEPVLARRGDYPERRGADFVAFLVELLATNNAEFVAHCRRQGRGVAVAPFSHDTQYRLNLPWSYLNSLGEVGSSGMYFWHHNSALSNPPSIFVVDSVRLDGRIGAIYEINRARPSPYRAEFPFIMAAFAAWQDYDLVIWHGSWNVTEWGEQHLAGAALPPMPGNYWSAVQQEFDPVLTAATAMAGRLFLRGGLPAAPDPLVVAVGRDAATSYNGWAGLALGAHAFRRGARLKFVPEQPDAPPPPPAEPWTESRLQMGATLFDWDGARLVVDLPAAKVYVGPSPARHVFSDGIAIGGFSTAFTAFALIAADGRPLVAGDGGPAAERAFLTANFDAANTALDFDFTVGGGPETQAAEAVRDAGHAPVVVVPVGFELAFPETRTLRLRAYDFALRETENREIVAAPVLRRAAGIPWMTRLDFARIGAPTALPDDFGGPPPADPATRRDTLADSANEETTRAAFATIPNPLPGVSWGDSYARAHRLLRDGVFAHGGISPENWSGAPDRTIVIENTRIAADLPARITVRFRDHRMAEIDVESLGQPVFRDVAAGIEKRWGAPARATFAEEAYGVSEAVWTRTYPGARLTFTASEAQGQVHLRHVLAVED